MGAASSVPRRHPSSLHAAHSSWPGLGNPVAVVSYNQPAAPVAATPRVTAAAIIPPAAVSPAPQPVTQQPGPEATSRSKGPTESDEGVRACSKFRLRDLQAATNGFSESNVIGEGGFGKVYKGVLLDGTEVAVKRLDPLSLQGDKEFYAEVSLLTRLRHPNLVNMMGMCAEGDQKLGIFEFMVRGSVRELLDKKHQQLYWSERLTIALGAARGLAYLHEIVTPAVVHCDFKSSNVLIDAYGQAHVADFGLARHIGSARMPLQGAAAAQKQRSPDVTTVTSIRGTFGYLSPEYLEQGHASVRADVYAFGVVMLELITGQQVVDASRGRKLECLADWLKPSLNHPEEMMAMIDSAIRGQVSMLQLAHVCEVVDGCLQHNPRQRGIPYDQSVQGHAKRSVSRKLSMRFSCQIFSARPTMLMVVKLLTGIVNSNNIASHVEPSTAGPAVSDKTTTIPQLYPPMPSLDTGTLGTRQQNTVHRDDSRDFSLRSSSRSVSALPPSMQPMQPLLQPQQQQSQQSQPHPQQQQQRPPPRHQPQQSQPQQQCHSLAEAPEPKAPKASIFTENGGIAAFDDESEDVDWFDATPISLQSAGARQSPNNPAGTSSRQYSSVQHTPVGNTRIPGIQMNGNIFPYATATGGSIFGATTSSAYGATNLDGNIAQRAGVIVVGLPSSTTQQPNMAARQQNLRPAALLGTPQRGSGALPTVSIFGSQL